MAEFIRGKLDLPGQQERLLFMNCFGGRKVVNLSLTSGPSRESKISSTEAEMNAAEDTMKAYAAAQGVDISADLAAGAAAIAAEKAKQ